MKQSSMILFCNLLLFRYVLFLFMLKRFLFCFVFFFGFCFLHLSVTRCVDQSNDMKGFSVEANETGSSRKLQSVISNGQFCSFDIRWFFPTWIYRDLQFLRSEVRFVRETLMSWFQIEKTSFYFKWMRYFWMLADVSLTFLISI